MFPIQKQITKAHQMHISAMTTYLCSSIPCLQPDRYTHVQTNS